MIVKLRVVEEKQEIMWPFNRNKTADGTTPPEVQDYYQSEHRDRSWLAWVLGIGTLLATILVVLGLFYGGRWVYRKVKPQDNPNTAQVQTENPAPQTEENQQPAGQAPQDAPGPNAAVTPNPSPQAPSGTPTPTPTPAPVAQAPNTQGKAGSSDDLPTTGPADNAAIFLLVSTAGYLLHRRWQKS